MNIRFALSTITTHIEKRKGLYCLILFSIILCVVGILTLFISPKNFPINTVIKISDDQSAKQIATELKSLHIIRSTTLFRSMLQIKGGERNLVAGDYFFQKPLSLTEVIRRVIYGEHGFVSLKITIPEGFNLKQISSLMDEKLPYFDSAEFLELTKGKEGYLFPDTYFFLANAKASDVLEKMSSTFDQKIKTLEQDIKDFGEPLEDIVTMASIIEEEARQTETRRMISSVLWKRLTHNMPLQVDATFQYINGKTSAELTKEDLKIDSPYNTYVYKGLPPTPISNPGLDSIKATLNPNKNPYYYFLTDSEGVMHYATTHEQHVANKEKYLK